MTLDVASFALGLAIASLMACAWYYGQHSAIRLSRRIARHGKDLDRVFFEDAERDVTIETPKKVSPRAELHAIEERQSSK